MKSILQGLARILRGLLALPGGILADLFGGGRGTPMPPPADGFASDVSDAVSGMRRELRAGGADHAPAAPSGPGRTVHAYASALPEHRAAVDLSGLPAHVMASLIALDASRLSRLAVAGPEACGRWAAGGKSGLVGVPAPRPLPARAEAVEAAQSPAFAGYAHA